MYDPALGRWWQEDPRADIPSQIELTPYNFGDDDPVSKNDPNGDCPWCVGAIIGAATDYAAQVAVNLADGKDLSSSLTEVDLGSIATSAVLGAVTSGVSAVTRTIGATAVKQVAKTATQKAVQQTVKAVTTTIVKANIKQQRSFNGKQDTKSVTSREAFRKAKDQNGVPRSQQPNKTIKPNTSEGDAKGLDSRNVAQHEFTNSNGEKVVIRQDKPAGYGQGGQGDQGPHYNAGSDGEKLKQHHYYGGQ